MRLDATVGERLVGLETGLVEAKLDHGEVGIFGLEEIAEMETAEIEFGLVEVGEGVAEVHEHEVALMADEGEESGLAVLVGLHFGEEGGGFSGDLAAVAFIELAPGGPAETHHLMERGVAFDGEGDGGELSLDRRGCVGRMRGIHGSYCNRAMRIGSSGHRVLGSFMFKGV